MTLDDALDAYWSAAYAEGQRGATHDTEDGLAQTALLAVESCVKMLIAEECARLLSMPRLMAACDAVGVPANGENAGLVRSALRGVVR